MRYLLLLQNNKASAYAVGRQGSGSMVEFENTDDGREKFSVYLHERVCSVFSVLLDFAEEEHHRSSIPFVRGRDRQDILKRLEKRQFPGATLSCAIVDEQASTKSGQLTVGVTGVTANVDCDHWLRLLRETRTIVAGMSSVSLIGSAILSALAKAGVISPKKQPCCVFILAQLSDGDFRLSAYLGEALLISRKLTIRSNMVKTISDEVVQTQSFVDRLPELAGVSERIALIIGSFSREQIEELNLLLPGEVLVTSPTTLGARLNLKAGYASPYADALFAQLQLCKRGRQVDLSDGIHRRYYWRRRVTHSLYAICISMVGGAAVTVAATAQFNAEYQTLVSHTQHQSRQADTAAESLARVVAKKHDSEFSIDAIRDSVRVARSLELRAQTTPFQYLTVLAGEITSFPGVQITDINWTTADAALNSAALYKLTRMEGESSSSAITANSENVNGVNATIMGYVDTDKAEINSALSAFRAFVAALRNSQLQNVVTVLEAPFGISDDSITSGGDFRDGVNRGSFLLEVVARDVLP